MPTLNPTAGASDANSYVTLEEAAAYFDARLPLSTPWDDVDAKEAALIMATRLLDASFRGGRVLVPANGSRAAYYKSNPKWAGARASAAQRLAWPRAGVTLDGVEVDSAAVPREIKDAVCEYAGQLAIKDSSADNAVAVGGITSVTAGPVGVSFKNEAILPKPLPDAVTLLIPPDFYFEETITGAYSLDIEVMR